MSDTMPEATITWHAVCEVDEIGVEDVVQFEHGGTIYAVYHTPSGFYATDGLCTHEDELLAGGLVMGEIIECPRHQGQFEIPTGEARGAPVCVNLQTYTTKVEAGKVYIGIPDSV
jgi:3-phenylpropionate/trans-cinnamate dioxygenase ferredoxin subunit